MTAQSRAPADFFDQSQIDSLDQAISRAWQVLQQLDLQECTEERRETLALCVLAEARTAEGNHVLLVNRAIVRFRAQQAQTMSEARRA